MGLQLAGECMKRGELEDLRRCCRHVVAAQVVERDGLRRWRAAGGVENGAEPRGEGREDQLPERLGSEEDVLQEGTPESGEDESQHCGYKLGRCLPHPSIVVSVRVVQLMRKGSPLQRPQKVI